MSVCLTQSMHDEYNGKQHRTVHAASDHMYASRGKHVQKRQEQNKIVQSQKKKPVKSKLNTQKNVLKVWKMNGSQGIHRLSPWNKQTTRPARQNPKKISKRRKQIPK